MTTRYRWGLVVLIVITVALGLGSKADGVGQWANHYGGDIVYEMFWIYLIGFFRPSGRAAMIALGVFLVTSLIEGFQLVSVPTGWQAQLWWRLLLGTSFSWWDYPHYALGCILGGLSLGYWQRVSGLAHAVPRP